MIKIAKTESNWKGKWVKERNSKTQQRENKNDREGRMRKYQMSHHQKFVVFPTYDGAWIFNTRKFVILLFAHFTFHNLQNKLYYIHTHTDTHSWKDSACLIKDILLHAYI
jgi:hypothetical protein